jgi:hypothetical protein
MEPTPPPHQITRWLGDWREGHDSARDRLFAVVQPQLRQIAARFLHGERPDHTLEPNALVNELCLRLLGGKPRAADKRGGVQQRVTLSAVDGWQPVTDGEDMLALDEALAQLEKADPRAARVVELRFFGGLREEDVAEALGVSVITVKRDWKAARAWLIGRLRPR